VLRDARETYRKLGAETIPEGLEMQRNYADALVRAGRFAEAEAIAADIAQRMDALYGRYNVSTILARQTQGLLLVEQGQAARGEKILRECAELLEVFELPEHDDWLVAEAKCLLGYSLLKQGQLRDAEAVLGPAHSALRAAKGDAYVGTVASREHLAALELARNAG
jgi:hypothetical protein